MDYSNKGNYQKQTCYKLKPLLKKKWQFLRICYTGDQLCVILKIKLDYKLDYNQWQQLPLKKLTWLYILKI